MDITKLLPNLPRSASIARRITVGLPTGHKEFGSHRGTRVRSYGSLGCPSRSGISGAQRGSCRASGLWNFRWLISSRRSHTPSRLPGETPRGVHTQTDDEEECQLQQADFSQQRRCLLLLSTTGFVDLHIRRSEDQALP